MLSYRPGRSEARRVYRYGQSLQRDRDDRDIMKRRLMRTKAKPKTDAQSRNGERKVIRRAQRGDERAMRELVDSHKDRLFAFVLRTVRHHHDAEEVCQEAFLRAFRSLDSFNFDYRFSTWLFTIGYRLCLNSLRAKKDVTADLDFTTLPNVDVPVDAGSAVSEEARHLKTLVWQAVDRLSTAQRATVLLFYRYDQGCAEIASVLQLPVATVKSHLHRARARLKDILEPLASEDYSRLRILTELAG